MHVISLNLISSLAVALHLRHTGIGNTIHITDGLDILIPLIQRNISLNKTNICKVSEVLSANLSWGEDLPGAVPGTPDVLLAADCCYLEESFPLLLRTMKDLIGDKTVCYFCYKKRRRADKDMIHLLNRAFKTVEIEGSWRREGIYLYEIARK